jgi:phosphate transport system substrate-binding protein
MRFRHVILGLAVVLAAAPGCKRRSGGKGAITIAGSTSVQPFAEQWGESYHESHPDVEITVQGGGSTAGVKATLDGAADIGTCSRELKADEKDKVVATVVARDGETVIVNPGNPVSDLTVEQVRGIYAGEITSWKDVGGEDKKINVVTREAGSGARGAFEELAMAKKPIVASALVQNSQGAVRQMVSTDSSAIGYVSHGVVDKSVKPLKLNGVEPSMETVKAGTYPLVRPFLFLTKGPPAGQVKEFIDWVLGPEGQKLAAEEGLFPPN